MDWTADAEPRDNQPIGPVTPRQHLPRTSRRRLQKNFSLPELQCFISDSQLTRDAALHPRPGDRRSVLRRRSVGGSRGLPSCSSLALEPSATEMSTCISLFFKLAFLR